MDECGIKYALCLGDTQTRHGANYDEAYISDEWENIETMLSPIRDRLLITQGNHDGSYGEIDTNNDGEADDINGDGEVNSYDKNVYNFTPQKLYECIFRKVGVIDNVHFSDDGNGYYVDDVATKVRYILLNTHVNKWATNADGSMKYNNAYTFRFGQAQYNMVIEALNSMPSDDWSVIIGSHVPLDRSGDLLMWGATKTEDNYRKEGEVECWVMGGLLNAYVGRKTYVGSFTATQEDDFDAISVDVDFTHAKGKLIAYFGGHIHEDHNAAINYTWSGRLMEYAFHIIVTRCDAREENPAGGTLWNERIAGTITEQSFDVFTVNRATKKIYATKIGAGSDREINY
jgi:hypothetical protein